MIVLGIPDSSVCGGATIVSDDTILASIIEERLDRQKLSTGFPAKAIRRALDTAGIGIEEVDRIPVSDHHNYFKPKSS